MKLLEKMLATIAPFTCLRCGEEPHLLCYGCQQDVLPMPDRCYRCKRSSPDSKTCASCRRVSALRHVWVRSLYDGVSLELVRILKFERGRAAADILANMLEEVLPYLAGDVLVVHVPTATSRVRVRGYDQAMLIAKALARKRGLPCYTLLRRTGQQRQLGSNRSERLRQLNRAFRVVSPDIVYGAHILLVDDVVTTGATLEAAAKTLKAAGARRVDAVAFAQKD